MKGVYSDISSTLYLKVINLDEFKELLQKAEKQADELRKTISQLELFDLEFKFSTSEKNIETISS